MYDDNTTPRWAFLWSHGIRSKGGTTGWMYAHVWPSGDNLCTYTHLANLVMVPECFGSLTDKAGPLTSFLRWHAWVAYHWKPDWQPIPIKPNDYDKITWQYLPAIESPLAFVREMLTKSRSTRSKLLRPLMGLVDA